MSKRPDRKVFRVLDANLNRAMEGLRVSEDVFRFLSDNKTISQGFKDLRHGLIEAVGRLGLAEMIAARNVAGDIGRATSARESQRAGPDDILFANLSRVKESLRVLEEFAKLIDQQAADEIKTIRYQFYGLEKKALLLKIRRSTGGR